MSMRTTLTLDDVTLDDDVSVMLKKLQEEQGLSLKEAVNFALRQGLDRAAQPEPREAYVLETFSMGKSFVNLDNIGEVLATVEGEDYR